MYEVPAGCAADEATPPLTVDVGRMPIGSGVFLLGHGGGAPQTVSHYEPDTEGKRCKIEKYEDYSWGEHQIEVIKFHCDVRGGFSGGPVFSTRTGNVVGILTASDCALNGGGGGASWLNNLLSIFDEHEVPYIDTTADDEYNVCGTTCRDLIANGGLCETTFQEGIDLGMCTMEHLAHTGFEHIDPSMITLRDACPVTCSAEAHSVKFVQQEECIIFDQKDVFVKEDMLSRMACRQECMDSLICVGYQWSETDCTEFVSQTREMYGKVPCPEGSEFWLRSDVELTEVEFVSDAPTAFCIDVSVMVKNLGMYNHNEWRVDDGSRCYGKAH